MEQKGDWDSLDGRLEGKIQLYWGAAMRNGYGMALILFWEIIKIKWSLSLKQKPII